MYFYSDISTVFDKISEKIPKYVLSRHFMTIYFSDFTVKHTI